MSPLKLELLLQHFYYADPNADIRSDPTHRVRQELAADGLLTQGRSGKYAITTKGNRFVGKLTRLIP